MRLNGVGDGKTEKRRGHCEGLPILKTFEKTSVDDQNINIYKELNGLAVFRGLMLLQDTIYHQIKKPAVSCGLPLWELLATGSHRHSQNSTSCHHFPWLPSRT